MPEREIFHQTLQIADQKDHRLTMVEHKIGDDRQRDQPGHDEVGPVPHVGAAAFVNLICIAASFTGHAAAPRATAQA